MNLSLASADASGLLLTTPEPPIAFNLSSAHTPVFANQPLTLTSNVSEAFAAATTKAIHLGELQYGAKSLLPKIHQKEVPALIEESMMITKSPEGFYVFNNITLKVRVRTVC